MRKRKAALEARNRRAKHAFETGKWASAKMRLKLGTGKVQGMCMETENRSIHKMCVNIDGKRWKI